MSTPLTCLSGHQWQSSDNGAATAPPAVCPVCGLSWQPVSTDGSAVLAPFLPSSRPDLGKRPHDDPGATIEAEPSPQEEQSYPADDDPTLGPLPHGISPALRAAIPGYEILAELGRGGMGVVYKARDLRLRRLVALKMILAGVHVGPRELGRFRAEAEAVAGLHHPNIVQIYEVSEHEGRPYFALEFVEGGSLAHILTGTPLPHIQGARIAEQIARAIHYAHYRGIVHRDLKPANILLNSDGTPKITDFGLAKQLRSGESLTQSGTVLGTPSYMAPEQAMGKNREVGPASDVYALGSILYEMLAGCPPFRAETSLDTMLQVASQEPVPLSRLVPRLPRDLDTICLKCLQKEPWKRYGSAEALADDLLRFLNGEPILARPIGTIERAYKWARRRPGMAALVALAACTTLIAFIAITWEWRSEAEKRAAVETAQHDTATALAKAEGTLYRNRIALAEREWLANNVARARLLLNNCPQEQRQWEWHYLNHLCHADLATLRRHDNSIFAVAFSPDGRRLVSAGVDQSLAVWETLSSTLQYFQRGNSPRDRSVAVTFSGDGAQVLHAITKKEQGNVICQVQVLDAGKGTEIRHLTSQVPEDVLSSVFSADRTRLVLGGAKGSVLLWDLVNDEKKVLAQAHAGAVNAVAISPRSRLLASGGPDRLVKVWDLGTREALGKPLTGHKGTITALAFSPDGRRIASGSADRTVKVWEAVGGKLLFTLHGHHDQVRQVAFSPNGRFVASAGKEQVVKVWDANSGEEAFTLRGHTGTVECLAFSLSGHLLVSAGEDRLVKVWDATTAQEARALPTHAATCVAYAVDGRLATASNDVWIWNAAGSKTLATFGGPRELIRGLAFSPDGKLLATAGEGLRLRETIRGKELHLLRGPKPYDRTVAFSPDGTVLASGGDDGLVLLWDPKTGREFRRLSGHSATVHCVAFSPDGKLLASASSDRTVKVWEVQSGKEVLTMNGHTGPVQTVAFNPQGDLLASGGATQSMIDSETAPEGELKVWEVATGKEKHALWGHTGAVNGVAFSKDGLRLVSASDDQTVKLWDPLIGQEMLTLRGHSGAVQGVVFSPDGNKLASISMDQTVRIWNATPLQ